METEKLLLSVADYAILIITLLVSAGIGLFFQFTSTKTKDDYLLGGRNMPTLPVAFSLMATFMSATTFVGIPAEMYLYGTNMTFMNVGFIVGPILAAYIFLPIYFANNVSTSYEYLEKRFGIITRKLVSSVSMLSILLFASATIYAPALALSAVTNISVMTSIITIGVVCTITSALGGMKSVLWADMLQALLMFASLFAIIFIGCRDSGGISEVFKVSVDGGRIIFPRISLDPSKHYTVFNILMQGVVISLCHYGVSQKLVQRALAVKNLKISKRAVFLSIPMVVGFQLLCCMCGLIVYAFFRNCDPLSSPNKPIDSPDQLLPYLITTTMSKYSGLPGLCICGIFSASLSTITSSINSLTSITVEDIVPVLRQSIVAMKAVSFFYGILCIALAFIVSYLGNIIKASVLIVGIEVGPNLGVFLLGACSRMANEGGVLFGFISSVVLVTCLSFIPEIKTDPFLPISNECPSLRGHNGTSPWFETTIQSFSNSTTSFNTRSTTSSLEIPAAHHAFPIAYMWFSTLGLVTCLILGYIASGILTLLHGKNTQVPNAYLSPVRTLKCFQSKNSGEDKHQNLNISSAKMKEKESSI